MEIKAINLAQHHKFNPSWEKTHGQDSIRIPCKIQVLHNPYNSFLPAWWHGTGWGFSRSTCSILWAWFSSKNNNPEQKRTLRCATHHGASVPHGKQNIFASFPPKIPTASWRCPWMKEALEALSDSCTIFLVQGIYLPSEARFTPSPTRTARPAIRFRGAWLEIVLAHVVKMSSHSQESARKKCSMLL